MARPRVLVVDDSPTAVRVTSELLEDNGFTVLTAADGDEALEVAQREIPDVVILDIILPRKNGFQVCRALRSDERTAGIGILMLSSKRQATDREWARRQGADGYLTKPYDSQELVDCLRDVLGVEPALT